MKKTKENKTYICKDCCNSIRINSTELHCSTKIKDRSVPLNNYSLVGTAVNCSYFRNKENLWQNVK